MKKRLIYTLYFFTALSFLCLLSSLQAGLPSEEEQQEIFPHHITMKIGGKTRLLGREIEMPNLPLPPINTSPLEYVSWKSKHEYNFENPVVVIFSPEKRAWYIDETKTSPKTASLFSEGMRYIWTRDFELITGKGGNHATFKNGDYVLCAGTIHFDENGLITQLTNNTGHMLTQLLQLQQMVDDFDKLGALAPDARIIGYLNGNFTAKEFLSQSIEFDLTGLKEVEPNPILDEKYKTYISSAKQLATSSPPHTPSLARKVLDILRHALEERDCQKSKLPPPHDPFMVISESKLSAIEEKYKGLVQRRPHQDIYSQVLEIEKHSNAVNHQVLACNFPKTHGPSYQHLEVEEALKRNEQDLKVMLQNRPYPELYDQLEKKIEYKFKSE